MSPARAPDSEELPRGERFGKYLLVGEIAQGGMGEVFLAVQQGPEGFSKIVVVKRVLQHLTADAEFTQMFIDEARLAARLEHANIVKTYEFGEHEGQYYTTMEFLPGEDLGKMLYNLGLRAELMPLPIAIHVTAQLCNGLHFAHEMTDRSGRPLNLVHRDVNPANVLVTYTGDVKVIDFGVAKFDKAAIKTATGMLKGKFAYMSPEYIQSHALDRRSDVFSTGIVLWEMLTGRQLFARDTTAATMYAVMDDPIPMPSKYRPDVPPQLDAIVACALARNPEHRFDTAEKMRSALEDLGGTLPKVDARVLARTMEDLFGTIRAQAMCSIAQSRSLPRNISLVMKKPAVIPVSKSPVGWLPTLAAPTARPARRRAIMAGAVVGAIAIGVVTALATRSVSQGKLPDAAQPAPATSTPTAAPPVIAAAPSPPTTPASSATPAEGSATPTPSGTTPTPTSSGTTPTPTPSGATPTPTSSGATPTPTRPPSGATPTPTPAGATPPPSGATPPAGEVAASPPTPGETATTPASPPTGTEPATSPPVRPLIADPSRGTLTVTAPAGAVVSLDGAVIKHGSFADRATPTGKHKLVIKAPGKRPVTRSITIEANRETKVDLDPPRAVATRDQAPVSRPTGGSSGASPGAHDPPPDPPDHGPTGTRPRAEDGKPRGNATKPPAEPDKSDGASAKPALDLSAIRAAARSQLRPVVQCYERGKMDDPNLRGNVTVRITIAADGSVAGAQVASSTLGAPQVEACITHEVERWQLPRPGGEAPVSLSYPFVFE